MIKKIRFATACVALVAAIMLVPQVSAQRSTYWKQRATLFELLPIDSNDIVFLGNSITDGGEWAELIGSPDVKNRGISGDVVSGVIERLDAVVGGRPAKIFMLIGVNDVSHDLTAEQIVEQYETLVKKIREASPTTKLYLQSVMPVDTDFNIYKNLNGRDHKIPAVNAGIRRIAKDYGVQYIDLWPALADKRGRLDKKYTNDGLHLTGPGYKRWVDVVRPYVEE